MAPGAALLGSLILANPLTQSSPAYHEAARMHTYFYIQDWKWYEWLGLFGPLAILWWFGQIAKK